MFILTNKLQIRLASLTPLLAAVVLLIASLVGGIASSAKTSASHLAQGHYPLSGALNLRVSRRLRQRPDRTHEPRRNVILRLGNAVRLLLSALPRKQPPRCYGYHPS